MIKDWSRVCKAIQFLLLFVVSKTFPKDLKNNRREPPTRPPFDAASCICAESSNKGNAGPSARLAYSIALHNERTIDDSVYLFRAIRSSTASIVIHIDTKYDFANQFQNTKLYHEITTCTCGATVHVDAVHSSVWGEWSMMHPTLWCMEVLVSHPQFRDKWDTFINLSGDSFPVFEQSTLSSLFAGTLKGINFVTSIACETGLLPTNVYHFPKYWHKREHYTEAESVGMPNITYIDEHNNRKHAIVVTHFGSQWMMLTREFVSYLIVSLQNEYSLPSLYKKYLVDKQRLMTDETYIPSLLMHLFPHTLPPINPRTKRLNIYPYLLNTRYERMDEHVPKILSGWYPSDPHYSPTVESKVPFPYLWGPYYLGLYDLKNIKESGALFIRKVSHLIDQNIYQVLPVKDRDYIPNFHWPSFGFNISDIPNWEKTKQKILKAKQQIINDDSDDEE